MSPIKKINVNDIEISISIQDNDNDYICLTDIVKGQDGDDHIRNWMRNKNTVEFLGTWEAINNPNFKGVEFDTLWNQAGLNRFNLTPRKWIETTNAIGIISKAGKCGGTYAHKDIAFEFCSWISPTFKLYLIKEYQRLKIAEADPMLGEWNIKRILSKVNYSIHTDAIKDFVIPEINIEHQKTYAYANEADILNIALWGCTAKQWRDANPSYVEKNLNIRDTASINELVVLSNLESFNAELLKMKLDKATRFKLLNKMAQEQIKHLTSINAEKRFRIIDQIKPVLPKGETE
ncbi:MAG: KilA-N domain-containing protein [Odoribacter sp.]